MNDYEGFTAYKTYVALRAHFTGNYDFIKYSGKMKINEASFLKRRDRFFFAKIERNYKDNLVNFFVASFVNDSSSWSGSLTGDKAQNVYQEWNRKISSLSYIFSEEIIHLSELGSFPVCYRCDSVDHPILLKEYLGGRISIETMCIINSIVSFNRWKLDDIIWDEVKTLIDNYTPFLNIDKPRYAKIMREKWDDKSDNSS